MKYVLSSQMINNKKFDLFCLVILMNSSLLACCGGELSNFGATIHNILMLDDFHFLLQSSPLILSFLNLRPARLSLI